MPKKTVISLITAAALFSCTSCTAAPPCSPSEEIMLHSWYSAEQKVRLSFEDGELLMKSEDNGGKLCLKGKCFTANDSLTVLSYGFGTVIMTYKLKNDELELTYFGKTAIFVKYDDLIDNS